jgi:cytidylate kinase
MTLVAMSASYGAGGSRIGPAVARRLGVPFVDRAIPVKVAEHLDIPLEEATAYDERPSESWLDKLLRGFIGTDVGAPTPMPAEEFTSEDFARATEEVLRRQAQTGEGVILGRGSVIVLRQDPGVLRVRLDGPVQRRVARAMELGGIDAETAKRALRRLDRTHAEYAKRFYDADITDPALYHLWLDSTAIDDEACVEMIVTAARSLALARARRES